MQMYAGMGILAWIILGGIAGIVARALMRQRRRGCLLDVVVGVVGAVLGGALFSALGGVGITGFNVYSLVVAVVGSVLFLWFLNILRKHG